MIKRNKHKQTLPFVNLKCTKLQKRKFLHFLLKNNCYDEYLTNIYRYPRLKVIQGDKIDNPWAFIYLMFNYHCSESLCRKWSMLDLLWQDFYPKRLRHKT